MNAQLSPQDCIFHLLAKAARTGINSWKKATADLGVTAVQAKTLAFLHVYGDVSVGELGKQLALDSATMTGLLDRLESQQFIERRAIPGDRRAVQICLTETGQVLADTIYQRLQPANEQFLAKLSEAEAAMLRDILKRF